MMIEITNTEKEKLKELLEDLKFIFSKPEILYERVGDIVDELKTNEAKSYLNNLVKGSKPEQALREAFLAGKSVLTKYLFKEIAPEVYEKDSGFIDYKIQGEGGRFVLLELKSAFERDKNGLKLKKLKWEDHKKQITKYVKEEGSRFIILTNLNEWYFFSSKDCITEETTIYFHESDLFTFYDRYELGEGLWDYLEREEFLSIREPLDKKFFTDLKKWVKLLSEVEVELDDKSKTESIIWLINKFIFIQTLDDYGVIDFQWIRNRWDTDERMWSRKGKLLVLKEFLGFIDRWFYEYYDTELFMNNNLLKYIKKDETNINKFYRHIQLVLGLTYMQTSMAGFRGVMQYNFRKVDEDILGKAYETFLAEVRKEQGIYYTPPYVTEYITKNAVGVLFDDLIKQIKSAIEKEDFEKAKEYVNKFTQIRILDPACGSGSFLIKAIRLIWKKYQELNEILNDYNGVKKKEKQNNKGLDKYEDDKIISELKKILSLGDNRLLISKMILRHIHGNDLDKKALDVAKVNIWLEAIKLSPKDFKVQNLPSDTNHILPNLEMNFGNGDSLVGLPEKETIEYLQNNHKEELIKLFELRNKYLEDPTDPDLVMEIENVLFELRKELNREFKQYLKDNNLPEGLLQETIPFHWALEFWYNFFDHEGLKIDKNMGFDNIIGNPPYFSGIKVSKDELKFLEYFFGNLWAARNDISYYFLLRGQFILKKEGYLSYIFPRYYIKSHYARSFRDYLKHNTSIIRLIDTENFQVFEDANILTTIILLKNQYNQQNLIGFTRVKKWKRSGKELFEIIKDEKTQEEIELLKVNQSDLHEDAWEFVAISDKHIIEKVRKGSKPLVEFCLIGKGMSTGYNDAFEVSAEVISNEHLEKSGLRKLIKNGDIRRFCIIDNQHFVIYPQNVGDINDFPNIKKHLLKFKKEIEERKNYSGPWYKYTTPRNIDIFDSNRDKIVVPFMATENRFAIDKDKSIPTSGDVHAILLKDEYQNLMYVFLSILNSKLIMWHHKKVTQLKRDDYIEFNKKQLEKLPIIINQNLTKNLKAFADFIIKQKTAFDELYIKFALWTTKLKNYEYTLHHILTNDLRETREGNFKNAWTSKVTFYPNGNDDKLKQEYIKFKTKQNSQNNSIKIHGLKEDGSYEEVYEVIFTKKELMQLIYFVLHQTLNSRSRIKNLDSLFKKTIVPVIQPNIVQSTPNIIKKIEQEFKDWLKKEGIKEKVPIDLGEIEKQIQETDNLIDAYVFKLYDLNKEEIITVLDSLKVEGDIKEDILKKVGEVKK